MSKFNVVQNAVSGARDAAAEFWRATEAEVRSLMRRRVKPRFWLFLITMTLAVFLASFAAMNQRCAQGAVRLQRAIERRDALLLDVNDKSDQLAFAQTDEYVMRIARDELGMLMPGEIRYVNGAN